jgi:DNA-binding response OmpR family regulator
MVEADTAGIKGAATVGMPRRLRVGIADRDSGFVQTLVKRLPGVAMEPLLVASIEPDGPSIELDALIRQRLDALVLDVETIDENLWPTLERLCERLPTLAVIVCTGPSPVARRVRGLRLGVDAWITKPCHPEELISVVGAVLRRQRRSELVADNGPLRAGELTIRPDRYQAYVGDRSMDLTAREFQLLLLFAQNDRVLERAEIYERVWGYAMAHGDRSVDVFVRKLRQKLHAASPAWTYIHTHFGIGYRFSPQPEQGAVEKTGANRPAEVTQRHDEQGRELIAVLR